MQQNKTFLKKDLTNIVVTIIQICECRKGKKNLSGKILLIKIFKSISVIFENLIAF